MKALEVLNLIKINDIKITGATKEDIYNAINELQGLKNEYIFLKTINKELEKLNKDANSQINETHRLLNKSNDLMARILKAK